AKLAPERVAGVRRVGDHAAPAHDLGDLADEPPLGVVRVDIEVPGHAPEPSAVAGAGKMASTRQARVNSGRTARRWSMGPSCILGPCVPSWFFWGEGGR